MKNCMKGFTGIFAAIVLATGITACNGGVEHEHIWDGGTVTTAATCTEDGVKTYTCTVCGETKTEVISASHTWNSGEVTTPAACTTAGVMTYTCTVCNETKEEEIAATGHTEDSGTVTEPTCVTKGTKTYKCTVCGAVTKTEETAELYSSPVDAETGAAATASSTYIYFGAFPKTVAYRDDAGKLYAADKTTEITIDETVSVKMGGNTYYKGSDGEYYAKVTENCLGSSGYTYSDSTTVKQSSENSIRYFKVEPVKWKVLTTDYNSTGKALLLAENVLTANVPYYGYISSSNTRSVGTDTTIYPNNYKYSTIRAYLNGLVYYNDSNTSVTTYSDNGFLQTAFTAAAQSLINTVNVDNSADSTTDTGNNITKADSYYCADTQDKIFLLSNQEVTTKAYGFDVYSSSGKDNARIRVTTDYAMANYAYQNTGYGGKWWLRSPNSTYSYFAHYVDHKGYADINENASCTNPGVVPALTISLK